MMDAHREQQERKEEKKKKKKNKHNQKIEKKKEMRCLVGVANRLQWRSLSCPHPEKIQVSPMVH